MTQQGSTSSAPVQEQRQVQPEPQVQRDTQVPSNHASEFSTTAAPPLPTASGPHVPIPTRHGTLGYSRAGTARTSVDAPTNVSEVSSNRPALTLADLRPGDVLLKVGVQSGTQKVIKFGQSLQGMSGSQGTSETVHAAIYKGDGNLLEATGTGLSEAAVETGCTWHIYRFNNETVAKNAVHMAEHHTAMRQNGVVEGYGDYATAGAALSVLRGQGKSDTAKFWNGDQKSYSEQEKKDFFCSQFVIRSYGEAAKLEPEGQPVIPMDGHTHSSPRMLEHMLEKDSAQWRCVGSLRLD
ncbi:hypothetical protein LZ198_02815 [Myxococcus sp. K15C18031901]|uniref:hypothetical protein n=1 Tax=Myxococcus dinghuensis TaxID=2906761 RepID=UPI0020A6FDC5|nr:hypothetical protein [Myxococcus dinghuensis]MCP3097801.1 hypothetical protein [Myxococcus dinghuensis]